MKAISDHKNETIKKLNSILLTKVNMSINDVNLERTPSKGTEAIVQSTKILHDILIDYFQKNTLQEIFTKETVQPYIDKVHNIEVISRMGAEALKEDIAFYFDELKFLNDLRPKFSEFRIEA